MSSSFLFHGAVSIRMEAKQADDQLTSWVTIKIADAGDQQWHNRHETTIFVAAEDYPYYARAVDAFNETLAEFYQIKADEASANEIDETVPF